MEICYRYSMAVGAIWLGATVPIVRGAGPRMRGYNESYGT